MRLNSDKPDRWGEDSRRSVELFNAWYLANAPKTFVSERQRATEYVSHAFAMTGDLANVTPEVLRQNPAVMQVLRMATLPPLARDRLVGLAGVAKSVVERLESGRLPTRSRIPIGETLERICAVIEPLLDRELFPWRVERREAELGERSLAAFVVADRLCDALSNPILRNAHQARQREILKTMLDGAGYREQAHSLDQPINFMEPGTFAFGMNVPTTMAIVAVDLVIQPKRPTGNRIPLMIELKAAGDFANVNKRRKEESDKVRYLEGKYGNDLRLILFLCGYFDRNYLQYEADAGIDWVWEHRPTDLLEILG